MKKLNSLLLTLSLFSIAHISANTSSSSEAAFNLNLSENSLFNRHAKKSLSNTMTDQILGQLDAVHGILSDLSAIISDNQIKGMTKKQKKLVLSNIQSLMREIEEKKNSLIVGSNDQEIISFMLRFSRAIMQHVHKALSNQLKTFDKFDTDVLIKRSRKAKKPSPKMIHRRLVNNQGRKTKGLKYGG